MRSAVAWSAGFGSLPSAGLVLTYRWPLCFHFIFTYPLCQVTIQWEPSASPLWKILHHHYEDFKAGYDEQ
jgi:hypothetical protein